MDSCPDCGSERFLHGEYQDDFLVDGKPFVERADYCEDCGYRREYHVALRGFTDNQRMRGIGPPLPADPFDDAVPMLGPVSND